MGADTPPTHYLAPHRVVCRLQLGELLKGQLPNMLSQVEQWLEAQAEELLKDLEIPEWLRDLIAAQGVKAALDATAVLTAPCVPALLQCRKLL